MNNVCKNCQHVLLDNGDYFCRRYPPTPVLVPRPQNVLDPRKGAELVPVGISPPVNGEIGTCGEFVLKWVKN